MFGTRDSISNNNMHIDIFGKPDIAIADLVLSQWHWCDIKHILRHLNGMEDLGLFYKVGEDKVHIFKPFRNYSLEQSFTRMCLVAID